MSLFELCKKLSPFSYNVEHTLSLIALNLGYKEITRLSLASGIFLENAIYKERKQSMALTSYIVDISIIILTVVIHIQIVCPLAWIK
jgi:hypothetical protein